MNIPEIFTIGVYGSDSQLFFNKLIDNNIDTFCDIRRRRGVRGSEYAFVNSKRLQKRLEELNINYLHIIELSTPEQIRNIQYSVDKTHNISQRRRETLSPEFITAYKNRVLKNFNFQNLINQLESMDAKKVVLFCVEKNPAACHRSLVAEQFHKRYGSGITNL